MRVSDVLVVAWFIMVMTMDRFVYSYYNITLLIISGLFLYAIHKFNMKEKTETSGQKK
jgi:high-affinity Fe2+/Pb2+ permease